MLGLESTHRPVIALNKVWMSTDEGLNYLFSNSGDTPTSFDFLIEFLKLDKEASNPQKGFFGNTKVHTLTLYPDLTIRNFWSSIQDSILISPDKYDYILRIYWEYSPHYPAWIPGISKYQDVRYYIYFHSDKTWRILPEPQLNNYLHFFSDLGEVKL